MGGIVSSLFVVREKNRERIAYTMFGKLARVAAAE